MIVFSGWGGLVFLVGCAFAGITASLVGGWEQMDKLHWPHVVWLTAMAIFSTVFGIYLRRKPARIFIDKATGKEVAVGSRDSLFFIPVVFWGPIWGAFAAYT